MTITKSWLWAALVLTSLVAGFLLVAYAQPEPGQFIVQEPPARYRGPYNGKLIVHRTDPATVSDKCFGGLACAYMHELPGKCTVWMPNVGSTHPRGQDISISAFGQIMRHELAHCNGWPPSHPTF